MAIRIAVNLLLCLQSALTIAGVTTVIGTETDLWKSHSLVYAEVVSVTPLEHRVALLTLDVTADLAGHLDPAVTHRIALRISYGVYTPVRVLPPPKSRVVVLLHRSAEGQFSIPSRNVLFMPTRSPVIVVEGFGDPRVAKIIRAIRLARTLEEDRTSESARRFKESLGADFWEERP